MNRYYTRLFRCLVPVLVFGITAGYIGAQEIGNISNVEFRLDERVFAVMCAAHVAGYDFRLGSEPADSLRHRILADLDARPLNEALVQDLKDFFRRQNVEFDQARQQPKYVSFSLLLGPPPNFSLDLRHERPPAAVLALSGFEKLLAELYRTAHLGQLWQKWEPDIRRELLSIRENLKISIRTVLDFSRLPARLYLNRRLVVIPDPVDATGSVNAVHLGGNYYILVSPSHSPERYQTFFIHEYLHYLLDPVFDAQADTYSHSKEIREFITQHSTYSRFLDRPAGPVLESLINAVQLALSPNGTNAAHQEMVRRDSPFIDYFSRALEAYHHTEQPLTDYMAGVLKQATPAGLIASYTPPPAAQEKAAPSPKPTPSVPEPASVRAVRQADELIRAGRLEAAESALAPVLAADPSNANALFGLAQIHYARKDFTAALEAYDRILDLDKAPLWIRGWSLVKSGYCLMHLQREADALIRFRRAAAIKGDDHGAAAAATRTLNQLEGQKD